MKAILYKTDGSHAEVSPAKGRTFSYEELRSFVGGLVEIVPMPSGKLMVVNEEGKLDGLPFNAGASAVWQREYPITQYPLNNDQTIVGDALVCESRMIR